MFLPSNITLKPGDSGDFVSELQRRLAQAGTFPEESISGLYDGLTTSAVSNFQSQNGIKTDGIAGPETLRRLNGALSGGAASGDSSTSSSDNEENDKAAENLQKSFYVADNPAQPPADPFFQSQFSADANESFQTQPEPLQDSPASAPATTPSQPERTAPQEMASAEFSQDALNMQQEAQANIGAFGAASFAPATANNENQQLQEQVQADERAAIDAPAFVPEQPVSPATQTLDQQAFANNANLQPTASFGQSAPSPQPPQPIQEASQEALHQQETAAQAAPSQVPAQPVPTQEALQPQQQPTAAAPIPEQPPVPAPAPAPEKQSLRERISGAVQKLVNYIESKLSPSALQEVQAIGAALNKHGVQEKPIPKDAEISPPSQTPGIAANQQQELN